MKAATAIIIFVAFCYMTLRLLGVIDLPTSYTLARAAAFVFVFMLLTFAVVHIGGFGSRG